MTIDEVPDHIMVLAKRHGLALGMFAPLKLIDEGDVVAIVQPKELTPFGEKLVAFALELQGRRDE